MRTFLRTAAAGVALASLAISSAASAATETADAQAEIIAALDLSLDDTARDTLDFATIAESGAGGTVTLTPGNVRTCGSGLVCAGTTETPVFTIVGETGATVNLSLTSTTIPLTATTVTTAPDMSVDLVLSTPSVVLDGTDSFSVGGTLTVGANQDVDVYTGQLEVVAVYN